MVKKTSRKTNKKESVRKEFANFAKKIAKLESLRQELHALDIKGSETEVKLIKSKLKTNLENGEKRHHKALYGAFRKWFETILNNMNGFNPNITEKLMGHRNDLRGTYYNPDLQTRFNEFKKTIPELTIDNSERSKIKIQKLEKEKSELEITRTELEEMKRDFRIIKKYSNIFPKK